MEASRGKERTHISPAISPPNIYFFKRKEREQGHPKDEGDAALTRRILVGYDGTEQANRALELAMNLNLHQDSELHMAFVIQKPPEIADPVPDEMLEYLRKAGEKILSNAVSIAKRKYENSIPHLESGDPAEKLLELADKLRPDLVVLGMVKHSTSEKIIGTVSSHFLKARRYAILVVP